MEPNLSQEILGQLRTRLLYGRDGPAAITALLSRFLSEEHAQRLAGQLHGALQGSDAAHLAQFEQAWQEISQRIEETASTIEELGQREQGREREHLANVDAETERLKKRWEAHLEYLRTQNELLKEQHGYARHEGDEEPDDAEEHDVPADEPEAHLQKRDGKEDAPPEEDGERIEERGAAAEEEKADAEEKEAEAEGRAADAEEHVAKAVEGIGEGMKGMGKDFAGAFAGFAKNALASKGAAMAQMAGVRVSSSSGFSILRILAAATDGIPVVGDILNGIVDFFLFLKALFSGCFGTAILILIIGAIDAFAGVLLDLTGFGIVIDLLFPSPVINGWLLDNALEKKAARREQRKAQEQSLFTDEDGKPTTLAMFFFFMVVALPIYGLWMGAIWYVFPAILVAGGLVGTQSFREEFL